MQVGISHLLVSSCFPITLIKCLKDDKSLRCSQMEIDMQVAMQEGRYVGKWIGGILFMSCLLITLIKCLKGDKSLGLILKGVR